MNVVALKHINEVDNFFDVENKFVNLLDSMKDIHTKAMELSELEQKLESEGRELLRSMLQAHIHERGLGIIGEVLEGSDGIVRKHKKTGKRQIKTIFGVVETERVSYGNRGVDSLFPKDSKMNLPAISYSHELKKRAVNEVVKCSYDNAVESVLETTGQLIPKQQVENITVQVAQDFDEFYQQNSSEENIIKAKKCSLLILTADGKGVVMHKDDLRPATKKKAENDRKNKLKKRLSPGEKKNSKRMATVASVYNIETFVRKPEDFKKELSSIKVVDETPKPRPLAKRVWASVEKEPEEIIEEMFEEGLTRDPHKNKIWVALVDGNKHQIDLIQSIAKKRKIIITIVCDIIHVIEYLWKAVWVFFEKGDQKAEVWVSERFISILEGKASLVAAGIRRSATNQKLEKLERAPVDKCATYLLNKAPHLKYHEYLKNGFPIATGVIEGACRHLVKDRMEITGARWRLKSAEAVLKLRSLKSSGDFSEYWGFHEKQELYRNHTSKSDNPSLVDDFILKEV